ncbi:hypothetical protein B0H11DRAFT_2228311 [Mycena galericulata]|nr:hypothetical protein B0H11DRAFT_2228311 [Mycena galericulata]
MSSASPPSDGSVNEDVDYRRFRPGAGLPAHPIDVEAWDASSPIDVDSFTSPAIDLSLEQDSGRATPEEEDSHEAGLGPDLDETDQADTGSQEEPQPGPDEENEFECAICLDTYIDPVVAPITEPPVRDHYVELALDDALERGLVPEPTGTSRLRRLAWAEVQFP